MRGSHKVEEVELRNGPDRTELGPHPLGAAVALGVDRQPPRGLVVRVETAAEKRIER